MRQKQQGIGLLELMLSLAVIAVILIMSVQYYQTTRRSQQMTTSLSLINEVYSATMEYARRKDFKPSDISMDNLRQAELLTQQHTISPYYGKLDVSWSSNKGMFNIVIPGIPSRAECQKLACKVLSARVDVTTKEQDCARLFTSNANLASCSGNKKTKYRLNVYYPLY